MSNKIETKGASIFLEDNKYLHIIFKPKVSIDLELAKEISDATYKLAGNIPHGNIVDTRQGMFVSSDARKHFASQTSASVVGVAIFINSRVQSGLANLYFKFTKRKVENRLFTDESAAKAWIDSKLK
jgi:hypothetical protein